MKYLASALSLSLLALSFGCASEPPKPVPVPAKETETSFLPKVTCLTPVTSGLTEREALLKKLEKPSDFPGFKANPRLTLSKLKSLPLLSASTDAYLNNSRANAQLSDNSKEHDTVKIVAANIDYLEKNHPAYMRDCVAAVESTFKKCGNDNKCLDTNLPKSHDVLKRYSPYLKYKIANHIK